MVFKILGIIILSFLNVMFINLVICIFIKSESILWILNSILGVVFGFICIVYLFVGLFSGFIEKIIKFLFILYVLLNFWRIFILLLLIKMFYV